MLDDARIEATADTRVAIERLKHTDLMPDLRRLMREATSGMVPAVRANVYAIPAGRVRTAKKGLSLRTEVARTITRKFKLGPRRVLVAITSVPKGGKSNLARVLNGDIPWNHPVYGHDPAVHQEPHPYFFRPLEAMTPQVTAQIERVLDKLTEEL